MKNADMVRCCSFVVASLSLLVKTSWTADTCSRDSSRSFGCSCDSIYLGNRGLKEVPVGLNKDARQVVDLSRNQITLIKSDAFSSLTRLELALDLENNTINTLEPYAFRGLRHLLVIKLRGNSLPLLVTNSFSGLFNISSLDISWNQIAVIETRAFDESSHLRSVNLEGNKIHTISSRAFSGLSFVDRLMLSGNDVTTIQPYAFSGLSVRFLLMSKLKRLRRIKSFSFSGILNTELVDLHSSGVRFVHDFAFADMHANYSVFNLSDCEIEFVGESIFKNVQGSSSKFLDNIYSRSFDEMYVTRKIETLGEIGVTLFENVVRKISNGPTIAIEILDLSRNKLRTVPYNSLDEKQPGLNPALLLGGNPIVCDCGIAWLNSLIIKDEDFYVDMTCTEPPEIRGQNFFDNLIDAKVFENCSYNDTSAGCATSVNFPSLFSAFCYHILLFHYILISRYF